MLFLDVYILIGVVDLGLKYVRLFDTSVYNVLMTEYCMSKFLLY